ncbi:olfactory receptor 11A1-like [Alligator mississippiensis]|uniref:olfactory receptor 11A1-like n=1 Tax=Alligator mississippiensis TaxID=8496 RepID=UPI002877EABF|nr:olfactory receptor 11A1-like [Alligator mississippiensis]
MADAEVGNHTLVTEFILLGFEILPELQILLFLLFFILYIATMAGNVLIIVLIIAGQHLHTPMYFFLANLSCLETCYTCTLLPKMLANFLTGDRTISFSGCFIQFFFFGILIVTECCLLSVMSYDRYLAICKPLHYAALMSERFCSSLAAGSWISGFIVASIINLLLLQLTFCGPNQVDHFFCDYIPLIKLSCSDTYEIDLTVFRNRTSVTEFILLGFEILPEFQILLFILVLIFYIATVAGNVLIIVLIIAVQHLHTPMYIFLGNLSCLETCYTCTLLPRMLASFLTGDRAISFSGCFIQLFFFGILIVTEWCLLSVMAYDRYLAICKPLHYAALMTDRFCFTLAAGSWISGFIVVTIGYLFLLQLTFCGPNQIEHFFCDFLEVIKLSCSDTYEIELVAFSFDCIFLLPPFLLTLMSYVWIIRTIMRIPSTTGRQKAFSTCSSHIIVVTIFYGSITIVYMSPTSNTLTALNKIFSLSYTVLTPLVNPLIYSLRNKEVKEAVRKVVCMFLNWKRMQPFLNSISRLNKIGHNRNPSC